MDEPIRVCTWEALKFGFCTYRSVQMGLLNSVQLFVITLFLFGPCVMAYTLGYHSIWKEHMHAHSPDSPILGVSVAGGPDPVAPADLVSGRPSSSQVGR
jgi:hypothetical protein